ncbi:hypothetical protein GH714_014129 [Hevea brasiliensis]|uniref:BOS complex subunit TMEM147 n=1 Tax=Hevea brasiliensis TaxID=3981 RepID=A0A6A6NH01_HEVBR|nr:hypothetical protein GH714_014129 [Hevea brasiliensis]
MRKISSFNKKLRNAAYDDFVLVLIVEMSSSNDAIEIRPYCMSEYDTLGTSVKAALVYLGTALVKLVCLATFLKVSENDSFDPYQELLKALIGFIDVAGLYFALTHLTHRNISQNHKFQAVGLGWAFADSVLHKLAPLWVGARGLEFTWDYILQGLEANANLLKLPLLAVGQDGSLENNFRYEYMGSILDGRRMDRVLKCCKG